LLLATPIWLMWSGITKARSF